ncbi:MAG: hypothetical protein ACHQ50_03190 [Fimbriimonadales bacterium]
MTISLRTALVLASAVIAVFALDSVPLAQVVIIRPHRQHKIKLAKTNFRTRKVHRVKAVKDPAMVAAARDAKLAHQTMKLALPIYEGHQALAMKLCSLADRDIKQGLKVLPAAIEAGFIPRKPLRAHRARKALFTYTKEQIRASNVQLQKAASLIQSALASLSQATGRYGGYRAQAANSLNQALQEIDTALKLRDG